MIDESYSTKIVVLRSSLNTPKIKAPDEFHSTKRRKKVSQLPKRKSFHKPLPHKLLLSLLLVLIQLSL